MQNTTTKSYGNNGRGMSVNTFFSDTELDMITRGVPDRVREKIAEQAVKAFYESNGEKIVMGIDLGEMTESVTKMVIAKVVERYVNENWVKIIEVLDVRAVSNLAIAEAAQLIRKKFVDPS